MRSSVFRDRGIKKRPHAISGADHGREMFRRRFTSHAVSRTLMKTACPAENQRGDYRGESDHNQRDSAHQSRLREQFVSLVQAKDHQ
jgi:hypothetical protein